MDYPDELKRQMDYEACKRQASDFNRHLAAQSVNSFNSLNNAFLSQQIQGTGTQLQSASVNQALRSDKSPVEVATARLFDRLSHLHHEVEHLVDRLAPALRAEEIGAGSASSRAPAECQVVDSLDTAAERIELAIERLSSARARLCM